MERLNHGMTNRARRRNLAVVAGLLAAVILGVWLWPAGHLQATAPDVSEHSRGDASASARTATQVSSGPLLRTPVVCPEGHATIVALTDAARPVGGVACFEGLGEFYPPQPGAVPVAVTDAAGAARLQVPATGEIPVIALWKTGYAVTIVEGLAPGMVREVVLRTAPEVTLRVTDGEGRPVPGFVVGIDSADLAEASMRHAIADPARSMAVVPRRQSDGSPGMIGRSDASGVVRVAGLPAGRYFLRLNLTHLPLWMRRTSGNPCVIDLPGPDQDIVVEELVGAVVSFSGDRVIACEDPTGRCGLMRTPDPAYMDAIAVAKRQLEARFPGATVMVGAAGEPQGSKRELVVFGERSGWTRVPVILRPVSGCTGADPVFLEAGREHQGAWVTVNARAGREVHALPGAIAGLGFCSAKDPTHWLAWRSCSLGERVPVPSGHIVLRPAGELPHGAFAQQEVVLGPGEDRVLEVDLTGWRRIAIELEWPDEGRPQWGVLVRGDVGRVEGVSGERYSFFSARDELPFQVFVRGRVTTRGVLRRSACVERDGVLVWRVPTPAVVQ